MKPAKAIRCTQWIHNEPSSAFHCSAVPCTPCSSSKSAMASGEDHVLCSSKTHCFLRSQHSPSGSPKGGRRRWGRIGGEPWPAWQCQLTKTAGLQWDLTPIFKIFTAILKLNPHRSKQNAAIRPPGTALKMPHTHRFRAAVTLEEWV